MLTFSRFLIGLLVFSQGTGAADLTPLAPLPLEIALSTPIETSLAIPGIRSTQEIWLDIVRSAKTSLDIEQFYISSKPGEALEPVLNAIHDAANRAVHVRIIVDKSFYKNYATDPDALARIPNIEVRTLDYSSLKGIQHAKYLVADKTQAYVGSANFDWLALSHIHEVGLHVTQPQVGADLETIFEADWAKSLSTTQESAEKQTEQVNEAPVTTESLISSPIQVLASPPATTPGSIPATLPQIVTMIGGARSSVKIQVYQYTTKTYDGSSNWPALDQAIRSAASRGVSVELLVDAVSLKNGKADLQGLAGISGVQVKTVVIPNWSGGMIPYARLIHSKYVIVDNARCWVGSENWSKDYFFSSRNVGLLIASPETATGLAQIFDRLWSSSYATIVTH